VWATRNLIRREQDYLLCYNIRCMRAVDTIFERYQIYRGNMTHLQKDKLLLNRKVYRLNLLKKMPDTQQLIQAEWPCCRSASVCVTAVKSRCWHIWMLWCPIDSDTQKIIQYCPAPLWTPKPNFWQSYYLSPINCFSGSSICKWYGMAEHGSENDGKRVHYHCTRTWF
jgi:hypothetical protein